MRGAGGAPRGLRAHQNPLQERDRHRRLTRHRIWPRSPKIKRRSTKTATKGGTATQASQGTRQATTPGRQQGKRPKEQASRHQNRLTNIFSSSRQIWPEEQENFLQGHQYRPAKRSPAADTIGTARMHRRAPIWASNTSLATTARSNTSKHQRTSKNTYCIQLQRVQKIPKPREWQRAKKARRAAEPRRKSISKQGRKGEKAGGKMLVKNALQRVVSISRRPRGWGSSD